MLKKESVELIEKEIKNICELEDSLLKLEGDKDEVVNICNTAKYFFRTYLNLAEHNAKANVNITVTAN